MEQLNMNKETVLFCHEYFIATFLTQLWIYKKNL